MESLFQILLFGGVFFLMMRFGCGSHMFGHGKGQNKKTQAGESADIPLEHNRDQGSPPRNDIDPVCGKTVPTDKAKTSLYGGMVYFLCTTECREAFEADPGKYVKKDDRKKLLNLGHHPVKDQGHA